MSDPTWLPDVLRAEGLTCDIYPGVRSQMKALMAVRDLEVERQRADKMRDDSNTLYELRGWLRLCDDDPAGHAEFYQWACHYIFGDEMPNPT